MTTIDIDYYLAPQSPWAYLGHQRFTEIAYAGCGAVTIMPIDLGKVFPVSGGLPLGQRAPQRQAYRLTELARFRDFTGLPLNLQPRHFPVPGDAAARLIITVQAETNMIDAMKFTGTVLAAVWAQDRNIDDPATLAALLAENALSPDLLEQSRGAGPQKTYERYTQMAIDAGVFGSPSYVIDGEIFWGQDRLDFVDRRLRRRD